MGLHIYLYSCTVHGRKVLAGLDLIGLRYDSHHIDYFNGEQKRESLMRINPHATVPAAMDGDLTLTEPNAILMYAADAAGNSSAYPTDLKLRADGNGWLLWEASVWFHTNHVYLVEHVIKPLSGAQADQSVIDREAPRFHAAAANLDARLAQTGKWILHHSEPTIVDIAVASSMHLYEAQKLPLEQYGAIRKWLHELEKLPSWQKTQPAVDKALLPHKSFKASC